MNDSDRIAELRITWLEAEVAEVCSVARGLRDKLDEIKEVIGGASLHPETGVSVVDDVRDLKAENKILKEGGIIEVAVRNPSVKDYCNHWEGRATKAEAENLRLSEQVKAEVDAAVRAERLLFALAQNGLREIVQHVNNGCSDGTCCLELAEESLAECDRLSKLENEDNE
jgi:hypothetical protein